MQRASWSIWVDVEACLIGQWSIRGKTESLGHLYWNWCPDPWGASALTNVTLLFSLYPEPNVLRRPVDLSKVLWYIKGAWNCTYLHLFQVFFKESARNSCACVCMCVLFYFLFSWRDFFKWWLEPRTTS